MRTLIIADNQDITRAGLRALFARNPAVGAVCEARSKSDLIRNLRLAPDAVVILDYAWFDFNRVEELCILRDRYPCSGWMLFSETLVGSLLHCSLRGERPFGVVLKRCDSDEIEAAFEAVRQGRGYVCESIRDTPGVPQTVRYGWDVCGHRIVRDAASGCFNAFRTFADPDRTGCFA